MDPRYDVLDDAVRLASEFIESLPERPVGETASLEELRERLGRELTDAGEDPQAVLADLARDADPGLVASAGPRYFGFVIGGSLPVALAADWLVSTWDQNTGGYAPGPATSVVEEVAARWVRDVLGLPRDCGIGFVTGCQMAHFTCLAAARHAVLRRVGWDVEADGLHGAPEVRVIAGDQTHATVKIAARLLGLGIDRVRLVETDDQGRVVVDALRRELAGYDGPTIVCAQAGEVNTGAFDPLGEVIDACRERGAWCHVDGAFGLWAAASPRYRHLVDGYESADSWATDGHKWLNVPYDCGIAAVADATVHRAAMTLPESPYIPTHVDDAPWGVDWTPEFSRRARGVPVYAALRFLGRDGVADLVDRCCDHARRLAERVAEAPEVEVLNDVVLNQVLLRVGDDDALTDATTARIQSDGTCWLSGSVFKGKAVVRVSVSGWPTTPEDIDRSADAIMRAAAEAGTPAGQR
jgi:glutamate/tyrosine decarboxylase-like PLP-dependent enzyme